MFGVVQPGNACYFSQMTQGSAPLSWPLKTDGSAANTAYGVCGGLSAWRLALRSYVQGIAVPGDLALVKVVRPLDDHLELTVPLATCCRRLGIGGADAEGDTTAGRLGVATVGEVAETPPAALQLEA